ncbi:MAG: hypothetical protein K0V04_16405 [Deltaproteobacteria bacterium]|nr:hypothetical protein [Deltaproteobacteria bacterium]
MDRYDNAIRRRLDQLQARWIAFLDDPRARLLRWVVTPHEVSMVEASLQARQHEHADAQELSISLRSPVATGVFGHGFKLVHELVEHYEQLREPLLDAGLPTPWTAPRRDTAAPDVQTLAVTLADFVDGHAPLFEMLAVLLQPSTVGDPVAYEAWLQRLVPQLASHTRIVVLDPVDAPMLATLARREPTRVRTEVAALDMPAAYETLSTEVGALQTPTGAFRHAWVQMGLAQTRGDLVATRSAADRALHTACSEGWPHLAVAVHCAWGSALVEHDRPPQAVAAYRQAERSAIEAGDDPETASLVPRLQLTAVLGQASAMFAAGAHAPAARTYARAAQLAADVPDLYLQLEAHRMSAHCHAEDRKWRDAVARGHAALGVGAQMDTDARDASTLAYAGDALLRHAARTDHGAARPAIEAAMVRLLGDDWRNRLDHPHPSPAAA